MHAPVVRIEPATTADDFAIAARLFRAYAATLPVDLSFQDFDGEVATLPGLYAAPAGTLLLARDAVGTPLGCVALRPLTPPERCEMKRLFLVEAARGRGVGRALVDAIVAAAQVIGYREMLLDTLPSMRAAVTLYEAVGFAPVAAYYQTPIAGTLFLAKALRSDRS